jgi:hypothetical protein
MHKKSQPLDQLDRVIEEIRRLMLSSAEAFNKGNLNRGEPTTVVGKKKQQQQHSWRGAGGELQGKVWDPIGFQHWRRGAHEQELMIFPVVEYDVGASLHVNKYPNKPTHRHEMEKGRGIDPPIFQFKT